MKLRSFFTLLQSLESHKQFLVEFLFHAVFWGQVINGRSPAILLIGSQRELICLFGLFLIFLIEMSIPLGLLVIAILVGFELVKLMSLLKSIIIFPEDVEVGRNGFLLSDLLQLNISSNMKHTALFLSFKRLTNWMSLQFCYILTFSDQIIIWRIDCLFRLFRRKLKVQPFTLSRESQDLLTAIPSPELRTGQ